eukprot:TRINITY_DN3063_c0_g1_i1.p1 TRINITY_DN3063_c0_g1~~TRINITY_DN3063_c0_g1_i1.p1  ORF type:complete len:256 (-),score=64.13 TRINITY_DN3063_c0_g1_i1:30-797(-)
MCIRDRSICTYQDAVSHLGAKGQPHWWEPQRTDLTAHRTLQVVGNSFKETPPQMEHLLTSPVRQDARLHWWNAQAAAYIIRPNTATRAEIAARRSKSLVEPHNTQPLPAGTISSHVRHGDKGIETKVVRLADYVLAAAGIREKASALAARLFVSTEDPSVIQSSQQLGSTWEVLYTELPRENVPTFALASKWGGVQEMLNSLMNLQLAVECDAWVCTLSSNWCRLIDELRSVVAGKANAAYVDVGFRCFQGCTHL